MGKEKPKTRTHEKLTEDKLGAFQLKVNDGERDIMVTADGNCFELREWTDERGWQVSGKYYSSIESLLQALFKRKLMNSQVRTLEDCLIAIRRCQREIMALTVFSDDMKGGR